MAARTPPPRLALPAGPRRTIRRGTRRPPPEAAPTDLPTEVGVAGGVDDVDRHRLAVGGRAGVVDRGVLREDRDALLALQVTGVHDALGDALGLVRGEGAGLAEHGVDQRGLAVVDVRDDGDVAQVVALCGSRHGGTASLSVASGGRARRAPRSLRGIGSPPRIAGGGWPASLGWRAWPTSR